MEMIEWKHLPVQGGILEQPEWLWDQIMTISWRSQITEQMLRNQGNSSVE